MNSGEITAADQAMSTEIADAHTYLREHEKAQCIYHHKGSLVEHTRAVLEEYRSQTVNALRAAKQFRDRMLVDLRALEMVLHMVSNASTHREKDARLRGCIELITGAFERLEREQFEIAACAHPHFDDVFRSDYPTRHYVQRIKELEGQLKEMETAVASKEAGKEEATKALF